ncbi:signal peptidase I [Sinanaerobacter chloroacetimidivorans]|jgi:signal peptidase I|uniref:Signal peptidase I n=1 Tax=Sinanaerobacter chloroacetimidivorans TaxID=2818044 RepID=A0A8J8B0X9_9FIRM|nr:signal peptidase I [Sinanaerobacter chloroacetimidivorans]MBR0597639.1 signal peptidase I [Sinanaerobacter chloroacetimidivorans]
MRKTIFEFAKTIIVALVIALIITTFIKPTLVKGYSMYPTIEPNNYLIVNKIPYLTGDPAHGDIIVFKAHIYTDTGEEKDLIKRVIGVADDVIEVKDGVVYRNGEALTEEYIYGGVTPGDMAPFTVDNGYIFVMGDNRPNSLDSRDPSIGEIPVSDILGRVDLRLFPFNEIGLINR